MILPDVRSFPEELHLSLGFVKNEKRDVLKRKSDTHAVKR